MKTVITLKDEYIDNSVRVNYFEKDFILKQTINTINENTGRLEKAEKIEKINKLLFCERLIWSNNESELDSIIVEHRQEWETKINS
jgi:hypothetical protein